MFDHSYPITHLGSKAPFPEGDNFIRVFQYTFKTHTGFKYNIEVEETVQSNEEKEAANLQNRIQTLEKMMVKRPQ